MKHLLKFGVFAALWLATVALVRLLGGIDLLAGAIAILVAGTVSDALVPTDL